MQSSSYSLPHHLRFSTVCILTDNSGIKLETDNNKALIQFDKESTKALIFGNETTHFYIICGFKKIPRVKPGRVRN